MAELAALQSELASLAELEKEIDTELDTMEVDNEDEGESGEECEVLSITDRAESEGEQFYKVNWKDGDSTWEPISNLGGSSDALRTYLSEHQPTDPLLKILSNLGENDKEDTEEKENGENGNSKLGFFAKWHQKTTRGSTKYWLRKGEDGGGTVPSLLKNVTEKVKEVTDAVHDSFFSNKEAPLAPLAVPGLPEGLPEVSEVPKVVEQSGVLFSDGEMTPTPKKIVRKRYRLIEQTVKMYPHEELGDQLENSRNKVTAMWQEMLSSVLLVGLTACFCVYLYYSVTASPSAPNTPNKA